MELEPIDHLSNVITALDLCESVEDLKMKVQVFNSKRGPLADLVGKAKAANADLLKARQKASSGGDKKKDKASEAGKANGAWESKRAGCLFEVAAELGIALQARRAEGPAEEGGELEADLTAKGSPYIVTVAPEKTLATLYPECKAFIEKLHHTISGEEAKVAKQDCKAWVNPPETVHKAVQSYAGSVLTSIGVPHSVSCRFPELKSAMDTMAFCGLKSEDIVHAEKDSMPKLSMTLAGSRRVVIASGVQLVKYMMSIGIAAASAVTPGKLQDMQRRVGTEVYCPVLVLIWLGETGTLRACQEGFGQRSHWKSPLKSPTVNTGGWSK